MKLHILFACLVIMMSVSNVAIGTIVWDGDWWGSGDVSGNFLSSEAEALAIDSQTTEYSWAHGWWQLKTTEEGYFDWYYTLHANTWADIYYMDVNAAWSYGDAEAQVDLSDFTIPSTVDHDAYAYLEDGDCGDPPEYRYYPDYPNNISTGNTHWFEENDKIKCYHDVSAQAYISEGSDCSTYGWARGAACISLDESE